MLARPRMQWTGAEAARGGETRGPIQIDPLPAPGQWYSVNQASFAARCSSRISRTVNGMMTLPDFRKNASISLTASAL